MSAFRATLVFLLLLGWAGVATAKSSARFHTISSGQRLGSIAKRYGVGVDALCTANGIERGAHLKVGRKLLIPSRSDKDGSLTRRLHGPPEVQAVTAPGKAVGGTGRALAAPEQPTTHVVASGQRLETIARRYQVSVDALCETNRIRRRDKLKPGQALRIPGTLPLAGGLSNVEESDGKPQGKASPPGKKGYVELSTYTSRYRGVVFDRKGKVAPAAIAAISKLFGATGTHPRVDARLIALLADVSEHFGGRTLRVVSGYRDHSYFEDSRHKTSQAVDFGIPGVSNSVLRDYVRRFRNAGVGFYPNSTFVHLDVREAAAYWVDYAGPGEAPRTRPRPAPREAVAGNTAAPEPSGPVEESQTEVRDTEPSPAAAAAAPAAAPARKSDITSGASQPARPTSPR